MSLLLLFAGAGSGGTPSSPPTPAPSTSGAADPSVFRKRKRRYVLPDGTVVIATPHEINEIMVQFLDTQIVEPAVVERAKKQIRPATKEEVKKLQPAKFPQVVHEIETPLVPKLQIDLDTNAALLGFVLGLQERKRKAEEEEWLILTLH